MKVIATNRNEKDFQSMIFETDITWNQLIDNIVNRKYFDKYIKSQTMMGIGMNYPRCNKQEILMEDNKHFSIKYSDFDYEQIENYWVVQELYKVSE